MAPNSDQMRIRYMTQLSISNYMQKQPAKFTSLQQLTNRVELERTFLYCQTGQKTVEKQSNIQHASTAQEFPQQKSKYKRIKFPFVHYQQHYQSSQNYYQLINHTNRLYEQFKSPAISEVVGQEKFQIDIPVTYVNETFKNLQEEVNELLKKIQ